MKLFSSKTKRHLQHSFFIILLLLLNIFALFNIDLFGLPFLFLFSILLEILLFIYLMYELIRAFGTPFSIIRSIVRSAGQGIRQDENVIHFKNNSPRLYIWIKRRFSTKIPDGLLLTIGIVIASLCFFIFARYAQNIVTNDSITGVDERIMRVLPYIRTEKQTELFSIITFLASWRSLAFLSLLVLLLLIRKKQFPNALFYSTFVMVTEAIIYALKYLIGRTRPEQVLSLVEEDNFSFPSGHTTAATVFFGLTTYFLFKSLKKPFSKLLAVLTFFAIIFLVGLSRIYLGVHFPSDILASIALGSFLLTLFITFLEINDRYNLSSGGKRLYGREFLLIPFLLLIFAITVHSHFVHIRHITLGKNYTTIYSLDNASIQQLPHYSETLTGRPMAPISFIFVGNRDSIVNHFVTHNWYLAEPPTLTNTLKSFSIGLKNEDYVTAPMTPSYLDAKPHDIAFEQSTDMRSVRQRHHIRFWETGYWYPNKGAVWVATASYDSGVIMSPVFGIPTHTIDPNIDAERDYIVDSLDIEDPLYVQVVKPHLGTNAAGDYFFTDGKAVLVDLAK